MMKTQKFILQIALLVVFAGIPPMQGEESAQEIFTQLAAPVRDSAMNREERAKTLPSLAYLPAEAEAVVAVPDAPSTIQEIMRLFGGEALRDEQKRCMESVADAAFMVGRGGSGNSPELVLPILMHAARAENLQRCERKWSSSAKSEFVPAIRRAFQKQLHLARNEFLTAWDQFHPAPIYYAITARAGHEKDFAEGYQLMVQALRDLAQRESGIHFVQHGMYKGVRMSQLKAWEIFTRQMPEDPDIRLAMEQREIYLLTFSKENAALAILCERPDDIALPASADYSMLYSPKLDRADAHLSNLLMTGWISSRLSSAARELHLLDKLSAAQACVNVMREVSMLDPKNRSEYEAAATGIAELALTPSVLDEGSTPLTIQMWQQGQGVMVETVGGAQGMTFESGKLRLPQLSASPDTIFYMESTSFSAPHMPDFTTCWVKLCKILPDVAKGVALTLSTEKRGKLEAWAYYTRLLNKELCSLSDGLETIGDGMAAPFALAAAEVKSKDLGKSGTAWAFTSAVKKRVALADGWQRLLSSFAQALGKIGIPPVLAHVIPVEHSGEDNGVDHYSIALPFSQFYALPSLTLSKSYLVLGNNKSYNEKLMSEAEASMPFCGAVNFVNLPLLRDALRAGESSSVSSHGRSTLADFVSRLAQRVDHLFSVSTIRDGLRTARALMILRESTKENSAATSSN